MFSVNRCEVTWSSVKSFSALYKQTQALLLFPVFLSLAYNELHIVYGWHCNTFSGHLRYV